MSSSTRASSLDLDLPSRFPSYESEDTSSRSSMDSHQVARRLFESKSNPIERRNSFPSTRFPSYESEDTSSRSSMDSHPVARRLFESKSNPIDRRNSFPSTSSSSISKRRPRLSRSCSDTESQDSEPVRMDMHQRIRAIVERSTDDSSVTDDGLRNISDQGSTRSLPNLSRSSSPIRRSAREGTHSSNGVIHPPVRASQEVDPSVVNPSRWPPIPVSESSTTPTTSSTPTTQDEQDPASSTSRTPEMPDHPFTAGEFHTDRDPIAGLPSEGADSNIPEINQGEAPKSPVSRSSTPDSVFEIPEELFPFLGGNPQDSLKEMREEQRQHEKAAKERALRDKADEEMARKLQAEFDRLIRAPLSGPQTGGSRPAASSIPGTASSSQRTQITGNNSVPASTANRENGHVGSSASSPSSMLPRTASGPQAGTNPANAESERAKAEKRKAIARSMAQTANSLHAEQSSHPTSLWKPREEHAIVLSSDDEGVEDRKAPVLAPKALPVNVNNRIKQEVDRTQNDIDRRKRGLEPLAPNHRSSLHDSRPYTTLQDYRVPNTGSSIGSSNVHPLPPLSAIYPPPTYPPSTNSGDASAFGRLMASAMASIKAPPQEPRLANLPNSTELGPLSLGNDSRMIKEPWIDGSRAFDPLKELDDWDSEDYLNRWSRYTDRYDYIVNDPTKTAAEIKSLLENIRPDEELPPENREGTPDAMTYPLLEHQKLGLAWLKKMEESEQKGGILADDMGLGKTIQALALMTARKSTNPRCKTTLIVAPVALMRQWEREIRTKLKPSPHNLTTHLFHGPGRNLKWSELREFDVVLTTFGTLASELKRYEDGERQKRENPAFRPPANEDHLPMLGKNTTWYRVILDEAQCIKNRNTKAAIAASKLKAKSRFCMTGTPMMNHVDELFSLLRFIRLSPWDNPKYFSKAFSCPLKSNNAGEKQRAMQRLQALLRAVLLRRTKKSKIDGRSILELPPRTTTEDHGIFNEDEKAMYEALQTQGQLQFNKYLRAGTVGRNYSNILVLILRLRQACCHPHLLKDFAVEAATSGSNPDQGTMDDLAKQFQPEVVARIVELTEANEESALECPVCMDMAENATIFFPCGHNTCSECFVRITDPALALANGDEFARVGEAKCPNCRGKISQNQVIDHATFRRAHMTRPQDLLAGSIDGSNVKASESSSDDSDTDDDSDDEDDDASDDDVTSQGDLSHFIVPDNQNADETTDGEAEPGKSEESHHNKRRKVSSKKKGKRKMPKKEHQSLAQLKAASKKSAKAREKYMKRLKKDYIPSTKIERTIALLENIRDTPDPETKRPEKTIIFSQFTSLLDLLEIPLIAGGWCFSRYDGSMSANARNDAILEFTEKEDVSIMLISLKAGNAGLNLTVASQVIILDPFWNPYIEEQAIDRAHRIGQRRPVQVHRILIADTIEDRILALQDKKREMIESALDENAGKTVSRLGTRELAFLFNVNQ